MRASFLAALLLLPAACVPRRAAAPAPAPRLPAEARRELDQEYYRAVSAYMDEDYEKAWVFVRGILERDPSHRDALSLRRRLQAAEKAAKP